MSAEVSDLEILLAELDALPPMVERERVVKLLQSFVGKRVFFSRRRLVLKQERAKRQQLAVTLLAARIPRSEAVKIVMERCQLRERTAYEVLEQALNASRPVLVPQGDHHAA